MIKSVDLTPSLDLLLKLGDAYNRVMSSGVYIGGPEVEAFEKEWSAYNNQSYCVAVGNGFDALQLLLRTMRAKIGTNVYVPAVTAPPTWSAVSALGATPIPFSVVETSVVPDRQMLLPAIFVNLYGQQCDIASKFINAIEDCCQSHGLMPRLTAAWCLDGNTSIQMANGKSVSIESLYNDNAIGRHVIGFDDELNCVESKITQVTKSIYTGDMIDVLIEKNNIIHTTAEHSFPVMRNGVIEWVQASDLSSGDFVIAPRNIVESTPCRDLQKTDIETSTKEQLLAYFSGLVASDGCMYSYKREGRPVNVISITNTCDVVIEIAMDIIEHLTGARVSAYRPKKTPHIKIIKSGNKVLFNNVQEMNSFVASKSIDIQRYWLAGFADGDGGFSTQGKNKGCLTFSTATKQDTDLVKRLLLNFGIYASVVHRKPSIRKWKNGRVSYCKDFFCLQVTGKDAHRFISSIGFRQRKRLERSNRFLLGRNNMVKAYNRNHDATIDNVPVGAMLKETRLRCGKLTYKNKTLSAGVISWAEKGKYRVSRYYLMDLCREWDCVGGDMWNLANSDICWLKVKSIKRTPVYNLLVYDIATDTENFCAEFVFVHNSFYPTKNLGCYGDSGAITTNDKSLATHLRSLHSYGCRGAINSRMDPLQAAFLRVKLPYLNEWNEQRKEQALAYNSLLQGLPITLPDISIPSVFHQYAIRVSSRKIRDALKFHLLENGVQSQIHYPVPPHRFLGYTSRDLPEADLWSATTLSLPIGPHLDMEDIHAVSCSVQRFFVTHKGESHVYAQR